MRIKYFVIFLIAVLLLSFTFLSCKDSPPKNEVGNNNNELENKISLLEEKIEGLIKDIGKLSNEITAMKSNHSDLARRVMIIEGNAELEEVAEEEEEISKNTEEVTEESNNDFQQSSEKTYQKIFDFSGNGIKKSEPFIITGEKFKIEYDCKGELSQAFLYKLGDDLFLELIVNTLGPIHDENIFYGSGEYYIDANMIGTFSMTIYDYK